MAAGKETDRTSYMFTAPTEMADAIELVSLNRGDEITAEVTPIANPQDAIDALAQTMTRMRVEWSSLPEEDRQNVAMRYVVLGQNGDCSLVKLEVPGGGENFPWESFYDEVRGYL